MTEIEGKEKSWFRRKVRINPHIEPHGYRALEWSYHFPLEPGYYIEGELDIAFAGGKVAGLARESLTQANLVNTRLSLADAAEDIGPLSLKLITDMSWITSHLLMHGDIHHGSDLKIQLAPKYLKHRAKDYWSESLFSRLALLLQSELKSAAKKLNDFFSDLDPSKPVDVEKLARIKRKLLATLRAAVRFVEIQHQWENLNDMKDSLGRHGEIEEKVKKEFNFERILSLGPQTKLENDHDDFAEFDYFLSEIRLLSEFSLVCICKYLAEIQSSLKHAQKKCDEGKVLLFENYALHDQPNTNVKINIDKTEDILKFEAKFFEQWAKILFECRAKCQLIPLAQISLDHKIAAKYFERVLELRHHYYQAWDVQVNLTPNDIIIDFWIGSIAAGISALFAFLSTWLITMWLTRGQILSLGQTSAIALFAFALANVIVYIIKDRLKELIKLKVRKVVTTGRWLGDLTFKLKTKLHESKILHLGKLQRRTWWNKGKERWHFHIWEEFEIRANMQEVPAGIIKQIWRLPLDEILDTLDDSHHVLKLPAFEGDPQEIPVLKRVVFPFRLMVTIKSKFGRKKVSLDQAQLSGNIIVLGGKIAEVK